MKTNKDTKELERTIKNQEIKIVHLERSIRKINDDVFKLKRIVDLLLRTQKS